MEKRPFHVDHLLATACFFAYITTPGFGLPRSMQKCYGPGHWDLQPPLLGAASASPGRWDEQVPGRSCAHRAACASFTPPRGR